MALPHPNNTDFHYIGQGKLFDLYSGLRAECVGACVEQDPKHV